MKNNIFIKTSLLMALVFCHNTLAMNTGDVRAPIPSKVDRLGSESDAEGKPIQFDIIHEALRRGAQVNHLIEMGYAIEQIYAIKDYCQANWKYEIPEKAVREIQKQYDHKADLEMIEGYVRSNAKDKNWEQIQQELQDTEFGLEDINLFEELFRAEKQGALEKK